MIYGALIFSIIFLAACVACPLTALAEMHDIQISPPQSCGFHCNIESVGFDSLDEAQTFWDKYKTDNGIGGHDPYRITGADLWFVDYQTLN